MKAQGTIIGFCYLYIIGIAAALLQPLDPAWVPLLKIVTAAAIIPAGVLFLYGLASWNQRQERRRVSGVARLLTPLLFAGALMMGYTRYLDADAVPDMRIGAIRFDGDTRAFVQTASLPDTSRLRIRKDGPLDRDLRVRLVGELDARQAVRDASGACMIDDEGRWQFQLVRVPLTSEVITVRADDPAGAGQVVEQPFTRITGIVWVDGPERGEVGVERISNHIGSFSRPGRGQSQVTVLARITSDPRIYDFKTVLIVTPSFIQYPAGGPFFRVEGGDIQVTVHPTMDNYTQFARTAAYGADIEMKGELTFARAESNPGGFDARNFLQNYNIYGIMNPRQPRGGDAPVRMIAPDGGTTRAGNPMVVFSLELRDKVLRLFKATMPYPQSAFLGGVTLGLRYGLQGAQFPGEGYDGWLARALGLGRGENLIVDDFRASGVNHVLAVSGLHVTIITAMFTAIFSLLRLPRRFFVPFVIFALVVFAIITGARPSTLRAVIMNSLFLLTWAYLDKSLMSSVMIGVPVAAFIILLHNPLVVVDPSFTLSFGAILSLALITMPVHEILCRLRGNTFLAVILLSVATTAIAMVHWPLVITPSFIVPWLLLCVMLVVVAGELQRRGVGIGQGFAFSALPEPVSTFLAAQVAIQVGMMIPLSAYYFCRWPFGGAYANLIAIPLIGVVVQLGAIAGMLGLIPVVGPFIALLLNAANWLFTTFFLWLAHVFTITFPYPFVSRPREVEVLVYYLLLAIFIWRKPLCKGIERLCTERGWNGRVIPAVMLGGLCVASVLPLAFAPPRDTRPPGLHITVLSVGYGSSILVESPGGRNILIDTAFVEHERGRRNEADRTILPFLSHMNLRRLDGLILTSPLPERAAGASTILPQVGVDHLFVPAAIAGLAPDTDYETFRAMMADAVEPWRMRETWHELVGNPEWPARPSLAKALAERGDTPVNRWAGWRVDVQAPPADSALFEETVGGTTFRIEVLDGGSPGVMPLRIVYGDFAMLVPGMLDYESQQRLAARYPADRLAAEILVVPHHAAAVPPDLARPERRDIERLLERRADPLLKRVSPDKAIIEFGNPRPVLGDAGRTAVNAHDITRQFYEGRLGEGDVLSTDRQLAVMITSDGMSYSVTTQAELNRADGGEADAVSDLAVGL